MSVIKSSTDIVAMQEEVKVWCQEKGWWDDGRSLGDNLILITSELVEALEAFRERNYEEWVTYSPIGISDETGPVKMPKMTATQLNALGIPKEQWGDPIPEGVPSELGGTLVRLLHLAAELDIDLGRQFRVAMDHNWHRTYRHGGKAV